MSESTSDNKEIIEDAGVVSKSKTAKAEKVTKAKAAPTSKAKTVAKTKKVEEVVESEVIVDEEEVIVAPHITSKDEVAASRSYVPYFAMAAIFLLVVTLTVMTFFQKEYQSVVASLTSITTADEVVSESSNAAQESDLAAIDTVVSNDNVQMSDQTFQANNGYQPFAMNQQRNNSFNDRRQNQRAAYEESMRKHNERMAEMVELRTAAFNRMDQNRMKMEVMRTKTQQIQLEMQQKMQAVYDEFHAI